MKKLRLAQSHTDGKWWSQDSNLDLTYSTSLCSSCRGRPQGKDGDRGKKKVQATGGQMKREHSASLEEDHKLHNPQGKREERRKILAWSGCPKSMEKGDSTTDRARPWGIQLLSTHGIFMTPSLCQASYWVVVSWRCTKHGPLLPGGGSGHINK